MNLYGSTRDASVLGDRSSELNSGLGEGIAYRGRILLSFKVELLDTNFPATPEATVENCLAVAEVQFRICNLTRVQMTLIAFLERPRKERGIFFVLLHNGR